MLKIVLIILSLVGLSVLALYLVIQLIVIKFFSKTTKIVMKEWNEFDKDFLDFPSARKRRK